MMENSIKFQDNILNLYLQNENIIFPFIDFVQFDIEKDKNIKLH